MPEEKAELLGREVLFKRYFQLTHYRFRHTLYQGGWSGEISREVFERGQAAGVLPYDPARDEVVLIRQFRAGAYVEGRHPWTWEIVAGILEKGERPEELVRRESIEEANVAITDVRAICNVLLSPGAMSESCALYVGRCDAAGAGGVFGLASEGENILVKAMPFAEAMELLDTGQVDNAVAVIALQWLHRHRDALRAEWR
ncbi:MAG: NUDIX domain-containing protein [Alphaproteobacteria bacterium]|nr:NUDIX domain-containing protein [Alphaproteobacteria bacterium]